MKTESKASDGAETTDLSPSAVAPLPAWLMSASRSFTMFFAGIAGSFLTVVALGATGSPRVGAIGFGVSTTLLLFGVVHAVVTLVRAAKAWRGQSGRLLVTVILFPLLSGLVLSLFGAVVTLWATTGFNRGRQLRRRGRVLLPRVVADDAWARVPLEVCGSLELRASLAAQWRENGRTEHASVAAFARHTLDLMALGAPPAMLAASSRDTLDEIRHAELCFSLARALDGRSESPGPFPEAQHAGGLPANRSLALAKLAVDSLIDGALHEGISARVIARLVKRCEEPSIREVLRELAADEGRHAAHGWDVVAWCLAQGGRPVAQALQGALWVLPERIHSDLPEGARSGGWERYGLHGAALEAEEHAKARADVVRRVRAMVAGTLAPANEGLETSRAA
jgi:hypothetical protein